MAHYNGNILHLFLSRLTYFYLALSYILLSCPQAAQLAYIIDEWLKEATKDADLERALKDIVMATTNDKSEATTATERKAKDSKKAWALAEKRLTKLDVKLGGTELKLAEVESLNLTQADEIANLKAALEACEGKWYNASFADAKNSAKPIVHKVWKLDFKEGWMAALQAMGVSNDSLLRNLEQIPFPKPPPIQNPSSASDKDTSNMRELV